MWSASRSRSPLFLDNRRSQHLYLADEVLASELKALKHHRSILSRNFLRPCHKDLHSTMHLKESSAIGSPCMILDLMVNEDLSMLFLSEWIDYRSMVTLDVAITNHRTRILWLQRLRSISGGDVNNYMHSDLSMRWLIRRGLKPCTTRMNVKCKGSITDSTFEGIDAASLRHVSLNGCDLITDTCISVIAHGCRLLQSIDLTGCRRVTDVGVSAVGNGCPVLQSIDLSGCDNVTDVGVSAVGDGCPLLQSINLSRCRSVTDVGVSAVGNGCPLLQSINLGHCNSVTDVGVSALRHERPQLQITS